MTSDCDAQTKIAVKLNTQGKSMSRDSRKWIDSMIEDDSKSWTDILLEAEIESIKTANKPLRFLTLLFSAASFAFFAAGLCLTFYAYVAGGENWANWMQMGTRSLTAMFFAFVIYIALGQACIFYNIAENKKTASSFSVMCYIVASIAFLFLADTFGLIGGAFVGGNIYGEHPGVASIFNFLVSRVIMDLFVVVVLWVLARLIFTLIFAYFIVQQAEYYNNHEESEKAIRSRNALRGYERHE